MKVIVVNNPAARSGGALTILEDFLKKINQLICRNKFYVFVSVENLKKYETQRLKIIVIPPQGFLARIIWDNYKLKKYLQSNSIYPELFISIQNTGVNLGRNIPQILYYHQPLSIVNFKWNLFDKNQRLFWMYKNIYPFFIKQHLGKIKKIIVQTEWVRNGFSSKFNYDKKNIILMKPEIKLQNLEKIKEVPKEKIRIFYPATPIIYKNHEIIIKALGELKKEDKLFGKKVECIFTFSKGENLKIDNLVEELGLTKIVKLVGKISYENVLEYYKSSDLMVFPSYLETFGLPLVEAQNFGINMIVADLEYSREVVGEYSNVKFLEYNNLEEWKKEIKNILEIKDK